MEDYTKVEPAKGKSLKDNAKQFIRVGDDYYKITYRPDKNGKLHRVLAKRSKVTITDDYGRGALGLIDKYEDFVIVPSHVNYQQVIHGHYNKYYQVSHIPMEGRCEHILRFLTHIFNVDYLDFALDYFQLLYLKPTQNLPIILLESVEKNTGKSTFGFFVEKIFQFNTVAVGNRDLQSEFNSVWLDKLLIVVDETSLDKKEVMQTIKRLSTEKGQVLSNAKGKDKVNVEFIGKFIFISNEEGKALPIERGEKRFAVFKVPTFMKDKIEDDPDILSKLEAEIPAFLYYLMNRQLVHKEKSRMYFGTEVYFTKQLELYFHGSLSYTVKAIQSFIKDTFNMFPDETELKLSLSEIIYELTKGNYLKNTDKQQVRKALEEELNLCQQKKGRYTYYSLHEEESSCGEAYSASKKSRNNVYYTFQRSEFIEAAPTLKNTIEDLVAVEQNPPF